MSDLEKSVDLLHEKIDNLSEKLASMPCPVNHNRIKMLERIVFGVVGLILTTVIISVCSMVVYKYKEPVQINPAVTSR